MTQTKMGRPIKIDKKEKISISLDLKVLKVVDKVANKFTGGSRSGAIELIAKDWQSLRK